MARDKGIKSSLEKKLQDPRIKSMYLKEVEKLFKGAKGDPSHDKDLQKLHDTFGTSQFKKHAKSYIKKYGLPDDWGALILLLDLEGETQVVIDAMEKLVEISKDLTGPERKGLRSKIRTLSLTTKDVVIAEVAEEILAEI
ncbi:MAG: hypothetical protein GXO58_00785 [Thermodesulfobacteria bacterium]|nr:hypothetical protein [Thermodesulfobacteriota bacterium]